MSFRFRYRIKSHDMPIDFCSHLRDARKMLIILPANIDEQKGFSRYIKKFTSIFSGAEIYFVSHNEKDLPNYISKDRIILVTKDNLNSWNYPHHSVLDTVKALSFDVCIDCNIKFNFASIILCITSDAKVRICLEEPRREPFDNLQIKTARQSPSKLKCYNKLFHFIKSCRIQQIERQSVVTA